MLNLRLRRKPQQPAPKNRIRPFAFARVFSYLCARMKIRPEYTVREMAGEHLIVMPGRYGADLTRVIALNASSLYLWEELREREFGTEDAARLLIERYGIDVETARRDAEAWAGRLVACGVAEP